MNINSIKINGVDIPLEEKCHPCKGEGYIVPDPTDYAETCPSCKGTGKQPIYYTPQQIEELTGEKWKGDVWIRDIKDQPFDLYSYLDLFSGDTAVCVIKNQPAPPADYRVED